MSIWDVQIMLIVRHVFGGTNILIFSRSSGTKTKCINRLVQSPQIVWYPNATPSNRCHCKPIVQDLFIKPTPINSIEQIFRNRREDRYTNAVDTLAPALKTQSEQLFQCVTNAKIVSIPAIAAFRKRAQNGWYCKAQTSEQKP